MKKIKDSAGNFHINDKKKDLLSNRNHSVVQRLQVQTTREEVNGTLSDG